MGEAWSRAGVKANTSAVMVAELISAYRQHRAGYDHDAICGRCCLLVGNARRDGGLVCAGWYEVGSPCQTVEAIAVQFGAVR